jgi:nucleotide-binding universal stress UspA family protein
MHAGARAREDPAVFSNIVIGVDGRDGGEEAVRLARRLAQPESRLVAVCVAPGRGEVAHAEEVIARTREAHPGIDGEVFAADAVADGLLERAAGLGADLLVVGSTHRGPVGRVLAGDDARRIVRATDIPVAVAPHGFRRIDGPIRTVGVGYDGGRASRDALALARNVAADEGAGLRALGVAGVQPWVPPSAAIVVQDEALRVLQDRLDELEGVDATTRAGVPGDELVTFSGEVDLLVVGIRHHSLAGRLLVGSAADMLVTRSPGPVLFVPAREPEGPDAPEET